MFKSYYGFSKNPFDKQQILEKEGFLSRDHKQMLDRLNYLKDMRGIGIFTAQPGQGKTFALRCFAKSLDNNLYDLKYIPLSTVSTMEFYRQLCVVLNIDPLYRKHDMFKAIQDRIYYLYKVRRRPLLLAIDEVSHDEQISLVATNKKCIPRSEKRHGINHATQKKQPNDK